MKFSFAIPTILGAFALLTSVGQAADCGNQADGFFTGQNSDAFWDLRNRACQNFDPWSEFTYYSDDQSGNDSDYILAYHVGGWNSQQTCWDAFENIFNDCMNNNNHMYGEYNYNGAKFIVYDNTPKGEMCWDVDVCVDTDGSTGG